MNTRLVIATDVVKRLGKYRALEAGSPQVPPIANPLGEGYTGVDFTLGKYRARIGVCSAGSGIQRRITLGWSHNPDDCATMYKMAHVALYGSFSWAVDDLSEGERSIIELTRRAVLLA